MSHDILSNEYQGLGNRIVFTFLDDDFCIDYYIFDKIKKLLNVDSVMRSEVRLGINIQNAFINGDERVEVWKV